MMQAKHMRALDYLCQLYPETNDLAALLGITPNTLRSWIRTGRVTQSKHRVRIMELYARELELEAA